MHIKGHSTPRQAFFHKTLTSLNAPQHSISVSQTGNEAAGSEQKSSDMFLVCFLWRASNMDRVKPPNENSDTLKSENRASPKMQTCHVLPGLQQGKLQKKEGCPGFLLEVVVPIFTSFVNLSERPWVTIVSPTHVSMKNRILGHIATHL